MPCLEGRCHLGIELGHYGPWTGSNGAWPTLRVLREATNFAFVLTWLIAYAVAKNIGIELVARFIDGAADSATLSVAGGTVGDIFDRNELQAPMMIFTASPFIKPPVGPMVAGFINPVGLFDVKPHFSPHILGAKAISRKYMLLSGLQACPAGQYASRLDCYSGLKSKALPFPA